MKVKKDGKSDDASFVAIASEGASHLYLTGGFHPNSERTEDRGDVHWHLDWQSTPDSPPPEAIRQGSAAVGDYPGVLSRLAEHWPKKNEEVKTQFTIWFEAGETIQFPADLWCDSGASVERDGRNISEMICLHMWRAEPPLGNVQTFGVVRAAGKSQVIAAGATRLSVSSDMLEKVEAVAWNGLAMIMA